MKTNLNNLIGPNDGPSPKKIIGCTCGCLAAMVLAVTGFYVAVYGTVGTIGWNMIKKHVAYEDQYYKALSSAEKDGDHDVGNYEAKAWLSEMKVVMHPGQKLSDVRPPYDALADYADKYYND